MTFVGLRLLQWALVSTCLGDGSCMGGVAGYLNYTDTKASKNVGLLF